MDDIKRILVVSRSTKNCKKALHYGMDSGRKTGRGDHGFIVLSAVLSLDLMRYLPEAAESVMAYLSF